MPYHGINVRIGFEVFEIWILLCKKTWKIEEKRYFLSDRNGHNTEINWRSVIYHYRRILSHAKIISLYQRIYIVNLSTTYILILSEKSGIYSTHKCQMKTNPSNCCQSFHPLKIRTVHWSVSAQEFLFQSQNSDSSKVNITISSKISSFISSWELRTFISLTQLTKIELH